MTTLPTWAVWVVAFGSPILAFLGVLLGQFLSRKSASELETRSKREETLRTLRWAAELAISNEGPKSALGVVQLNALGDSDLLDEAQQLFVDAALRAVVEDPAELIEQVGTEAEVVRAIDDTEEDLVDEDGRNVPSDSADRAKDGNDG